VVRSISNNRVLISIIDAITGKFLDHGVSPPKRKKED